MIWFWHVSCPCHSIFIGQQRTHSKASPKRSMNPMNGPHGSLHDERETCEQAVKAAPERDPRCGDGCSLRFHQFGNLSVRGCRPADLVAVPSLTRPELRRPKANRRLLVSIVGRKLLQLGRKEPERATPEPTPRDKSGGTGSLGSSLLRPCRRSTQLTPQPTDQGVTRFPHEFSMQPCPKASFLNASCRTNSLQNGG